MFRDIIPARIRRLIYIALGVLAVIELVWNWPAGDVAEKITRTAELLGFGIAATNVPTPLTKRP